MATLSNDQFTEALYKLLNASDAQQALCLLKEYDLLISDDSVDARLTQIIANKRKTKKLPGVAIYTAARGLLRRCRSKGISAAVDKQPGWPLARQGPLTQFLALYETSWADVWFKRVTNGPKDAEVSRRIELASIALQDIDPKTEPDIYSLILGLSYDVKSNPGLHEALMPAIECFEVAVPAWTIEGSLVDEGYMERVQHNLGHLYLHRPSGNRKQNIEKALYWLQRARELSEAGTVEHIDILILIGNSYLDRIEDERLKNIDQGIQYYKRAHQLADWNKNVKRLGEIEHNLAVAYRVRLNGSRAENYEQAKTCADKALNHYDRRKNPQEWARTIAELATIYAHRLEGDRVDNLEQAIKHAKQALEVYQANTHPRQWALVQLNLGNIYCDRIKGSLIDNNRHAIACFKNVLSQRKRDVDPLGWAEAVNNVGTAYAALSANPGDANYQEAVNCFRQALEVNQPEMLPARARRTAANWGNLAFRFGQWGEALEAFQKALTAGESLYQASSSEPGRQVELAESAGLAARTALCLLKLNRPDQALLQLEQSKTRLLAEALALGDADLNNLPTEQQQQAQALRVTRERVRELEAEMRLSPDTPARRSEVRLAEQLAQERARLNQLITDIRRGNPNFMPTGLDLTELLALIPPEGALVAPLVTAQGSAVFVLPHGAKTVEVQHVILPEAMAFTEADLNALLIGSESKPGWLRAYAIWQNGGSFEDWEAAIETFTGQLWDILMGPIHCRLAALGLAESAPIILMPQGGLGLLPLHAAWREIDGIKRAFFDDYTVTYAPSGYALNISQSRLQESKRQERSLLAVINPTGDLPFTPVEGEAVAALFDPMLRQTLIEDQATPQAVIQAVTNRAYLHFSCHGFYDWENVMRSGLLLAGGENGTPLTLAEIISNLDLSTTRLVTLSACETGLTEFEQTPDEYIGLPAGFLQAGAPGVVSTLWAVDDLSTSLLIGRFYQYHIQDRLSSARALRQAQKWLRDKITWGEMAAYLPYLEKTVTSLKQQEVEVRGTDQSLYIQLKTKRQILESELNNIREGLERHGSNSHVSRFYKPYYWAAFTMIGVGANEH